ncbi:Vacuolar protein sorting-associated protein 26 [Balamuthia mandrillaris]
MYLGIRERTGDNYPSAEKNTVLLFFFWLGGRKGGREEEEEEERPRKFFLFFALAFLFAATAFCALCLSFCLARFFFFCFKKNNMAFLFAPSCTLDIQLADSDTRKHIEVQLDNGSEKLPLYIGNESVKGVARVIPKEGKKLEHQGITIELIGQIEMFYERGNNYEFTSLVKELAPAGELLASKEFEFDFANAEKQYESYNGINVRLRYFLRLTVKRGFASTVTMEKEFWVHNYQSLPEINNGIKMEVGIEDCLHIEFEYNRSKYYLKDVIIGKIYFLLVRIKIKHMEIALIKRESTGSGPNLYNESETVTKFEIMDGAPVRGESIPIRLFLAPFDLTPTYRNIHNKFSLKYYLNLVLVDEEDRRYFKQQEIALWRRKRDSKAPKDKGRNHRRYEGKRGKREKKERKERKERERRAREQKEAGGAVQGEAEEEKKEREDDEEENVGEEEEVTRQEEGEEEQPQEEEERTAEEKDSEKAASKKRKSRRRAAKQQQQQQENGEEGQDDEDH